MSDRILYIGTAQEKLIRFIDKLGYEQTNLENPSGLGDVIAGQPFDVILIEDHPEFDAVEAVTFLRTQNETRSVPVLFLSGRPASETFLKKNKISDCEFIAEPISPGLVTGRIATQLRMRKIEGAEDVNASLGAQNAALRDYTETIKKELDKARKIQENLLPKKLPSHEGFHIAASYEPLDEVGGDWYYAQLRNDQKLAVEIADVTGHGLSAAFVCSMTKLAMTAAGECEPDQLLKGMNALLEPQLPDGTFVTYFSYLFDPASRTLSYARAGHVPALLLRKSQNRVEQLLGEGFALGFFDDSEYSHESTTLESGDLLLVMTDGIPEAQNLKNETYDYERMEELLLGDLREASVVEVIEGILDDFDEFRQDRILKDDVTLIAMRCK